MVSFQYGPYREGDRVYVKPLDAFARVVESKPVYAWHGGIHAGEVSYRVVCEYPLPGYMAWYRAAHLRPAVEVEA